MKRPAIFFDRDNTIIVSDGYLGDPDKVVLMDGAADAIARARSLGFVTVIVSNQSGVARGLFDEAAVHAVNRKLDQLLLAANKSAVIDRHEFCPFHPEGTVEQYKKESEMRKPKPGMIMAAAEKLALDLQRSWVIGDAPRDVEAGKAGGCRTILLQPKEIAASPAAMEQIISLPDFTATTLKEALELVETNLNYSEVVAPAVQQQQQQAAGGSSSARLENLAEQILDELRQMRQREHYNDFSVSRLMAGIVQVITIALMFLSYLNRNEVTFQHFILFSILLQVLTIALLIMGKDK